MTNLVPGTKLVAVVALVVALAGCEGGDDDAPDVSDVADVADDRFPTILEAEAAYDDGSETWNFTVTVSSPYDTPERYADGWRIVGPDGTVYGVHTLTHDHAGEQPFTRRQDGVGIPADVDLVTIEGRDLVNGFGGTTVIVNLDRSRG